MKYSRNFFRVGLERSKDGFRYGRWHVRRFSFQPGMIHAACGFKTNTRRADLQQQFETREPEPMDSGICRGCLWALRGQGEEMPASPKS